MTIELPSWENCNQAVKDGNATALQKFICDNEPAGEKDEKMFRDELSAVLVEAFTHRG